MPFEGWLIRSSDGAVWMVKGYEHPDDGHIAVPYHSDFPWHIDNKNVGGVSYRYLDCIGREAYVVPRRYGTLIDPSDAIRRVTLPRGLSELLDVLNPEWVGITGSRALGTAKPSSDYDLLLYSNKPSELYNSLKDLAQEGRIAECEHETRYSKVKDTWSLDDFNVMHAFKLLDSCYKGIAYTLRLLRQVEERGCTSFYRSLGWFEGVIYINDIGEGFLVPARYSVRLGFVELTAYMLTWRTRYQELPPGRYLVRGLLQASGPDLYLVPDVWGYVKPLQVWAWKRDNN
ncbi:nucleotidyltransferase domain-containing protein [Acidilobus sp.]|uniref:nucleotidyltransferase domain-containing protein n=1 Tax=Acidilobus sp. TaxID=1872109 RepID=UPI003CFE8C43